MQRIHYFFCNAVTEKCLPNTSIPKKEQITMFGIKIVDEIHTFLIKPALQARGNSDRKAGLYNWMNNNQN